MIRHVQVNNFKTLNRVSLDLGLRNVIVGPNMSGKTNFISLFKFLRLMVLPAPGVHGLLNALNSLGGFLALAWRGSISNLISIELEGTLPSTAEDGEPEEWKYRLEILSDGRGAVTVQDEALDIARDGSGYQVIAKDPGSGRRVLASRDRRIVSEIQEPGRSALEFEIPGWDGNRVRDLFASFRFYNLIPQRMKEVNTSAVPVALEEDGSNFSSWMLMLQTRYPEAFARINEVAKDVLPDIASVFTFPTQQSTVFVASNEKFMKTPVPVWQMSDGELCFLAWLSLILSPRDLTAPIYFVEEPENHLHPRLIDTLVGLLDQSQLGLGPTTAQVVATTHSLEVVDRSRLEDLIVFERRKGETLATRPREKDHLRELMGREEVGLGDLYYSGALGAE